MTWPLRALLGPLLWAVGFSLLYAVHGAGCAWGWPAVATPLGSLHHVILILLWVLFLAGGLALALWLGRKQGNGRAAEIVRIGAWTGLGATLLTLFPVLGISSCAPAVAAALALPP
ncbi:hypothetical protein [Niveispirillum fermenti]|uniref:hypothetical protein n=1 Tax=Niveispirillum fermenti TaxID=1233113 RepID=UPI003A88529E